MKLGLGKKPATFGLDIGSSAIKVIELKEGKGGGWGLTAFAQVPLPHDVISEGSIKETALVSDAVKECAQKAGVKGTAAVISVSGREAIMKRVPLPKVTAKELADARPSTTFPSPSTTCFSTIRWWVSPRTPCPWYWWR